MRLGSSSYWVVFAAFLGIAIARSWFSGPLSGSTPRFLHSPTEQSADVSVHKLTIASAARHSSQSQAETPHVLGPARLKVAPGGNLFVIDEGEREAIKEFSPSGAFVRAFSNASSEIKSVADLVVEADRIWVADLLGSTLHVVDRGTGLLRSLRLAFEPYRLAVLDGGSKLVVMRVGSPILFNVISSEGSDIRSFGVLLEEQQGHALALDGFLARSGGRLIYVGKYLPVIASYSEAGSLEYVVEPVQPPRRPKIQHDENRRWLDHDSLPAAIDLATDANGVYLLTARRVGPQVRYFIDAYSARDGSNYRSLALPDGERWGALGLGADYLYAAGRQAIVRWPRQVLSSSHSRAPDLTGRSIIRVGTESKKERVR